VILKAANCSDLKICHNLIINPLAAELVGYLQTFADININMKNATIRMGRQVSL
jgi:hypothetical protein